MDKYSCYNELADSEKEGRDFDLVVCARDGASVAIIAPHAGAVLNQKQGTLLKT